MNVYRVPNSAAGVEVAKMVARHLTYSEREQCTEIYEVYPPDENKTKADGIRTIVDAYHYAPRATAKALIVHRPDLLSEGGQNALRKTMEDLPPYLHVILVSNTEWK